MAAIRSESSAPEQGSVDVSSEGHTDARPLWSLILGLLIWNDLSIVSDYLRVTSDSRHATSVAIERLLRRLITLIYAGRDRMVVIRRKLPRTKARIRLEACRIEGREGSSVRVPLDRHCHAVPRRRLARPRYPARAHRRFRRGSNRQMKPKSSRRRPSRPVVYLSPAPSACDSARATGVAPSRRSLHPPH